MKKLLIASIVGGLIIFIWQFLSFAAVNLHKPAQQYTDKQDAIMSVLSSQNLPEGGYVLPSMPEGATMEQHQAFIKEQEGKPWATIQYHNKLETNMVMNMVRGFIINIIIVYLFCWMIRRMKVQSMGNIVAAALVVGLIGFLNQPYTGFIWYKTFDIWAFFIDAVVAWGLAGLWLGWYLNRGNRMQVQKATAPEMEMAN
jgi:hypothetical protein